MTIRKPPGKRLASLLLTLSMLFTLVPAMGTTAAAANGIPVASAVTVDGNKSFGLPKKLYYKNGDSSSSFTGTADDYNARYDPDTGVLTLNNYDGRRIGIGGTGKVDITIKLVGTNIVTGSVSSGMGGDITITSDSKGSLTVTSQADSNDVCGIATSLNQNFGSVTIKGNANVKINATNTNTANTGSAYGIYAYQSITISDRASVDISCSTPYSTKKTLSCAGMFVRDGSSDNLTIDTDGDIHVNVSDAGSEACSFGLYAPNYALTKVGSMEVQWKDTRSGGAIYGTGAFDATTHAVNVDTSSCYASYRHGTPYKVTVTGGYLTGPGVKYERNSGYFLAGDTVKLTAPTRYADSDNTVEIPFDKWVSDDVTITNGNSPTVSFEMPSKDAAVRANYNPFTVQPTFTRATSYADQGTVSFTLASGKFDDMGRPKIYPVGSSTPFNDFCSSVSDTQKAFTVYSNSCPPGEYVVGVSYKGVMCYSEPFKVKYAEPSASVTEEVTIEGKAGEAVNGTVTITLKNDKFADSLPSGEKWIENLPDGLTETVARDSETTVKITITGTPKVASTEVMQITIPAGALVDESGKSVGVSIGDKARFNITSNAPTADKIQIGDGSNSGNFSNEHPYYKNGTEGVFGGFTGTSSDYNAKYDPETGTLTLKNYNGPYIKITGTPEQTVTIDLEGNNNKAGGKWSPAIRLVGGVNLIVTADADANLTLTTGGTYYGIGNADNDLPGFVTISGSAEVTINASTGETYSAAYGILSGKDVTIEKNASLSVNCTKTVDTKVTAYGIKANGKVTVDTTGTVDINVSECGQRDTTYCINASSIAFKNAETITLKYVPFVFQDTPYSPTFPGNPDASGMKAPKTATDSATGVTTVTYAKKGLRPAAPTISAYSLTFDLLQEVTLTCATPGTVIYYTTDGSDPTTSSTRTQYSELFYVRQSCTLKAVAYSAEDEQYSTVAEAVFTRNPVSITVVGGGKAYSDPARTIEITQAEPGTTVYLKAPAETDDGTKVFSDWSSTVKITNKESCDSAFFVMPATQPTITASYKPKPAGVTVSGTVTSYGSATEVVVVTLTKSGESTPAQTVTLSAPGSDSAPFAQTYSFSAVPAGEYTLKVEKKGHAPRTEEITVENTAITKDVTVYLYGDVNGDGYVKPNDKTILARYLAKWPGYEALPVYQEVADLNCDGYIKPSDKTILARYLAKWPGYEALPKV